MKKAVRLSEIEKNFNPAPLIGEELDPEKGLYVDTIGARINASFRSPLRKIYNACTGGSPQFIQVLMGHRGCGKSTELNKMEQQFIKEGYMVRKINCQTELNLAKLEVFDIIYLILQSLIDIAKDCKIKGVDEKNERIIRALHYFKDTEIVEKIKDGASASLEAGAGLGWDKIINIFAKGKTALQYSSESIITIKENIRKNNEDWYRCIDFLCEEIYQNQGKRPVFIFENFDKMIDPEKAFDVFRDGYISSEKIRTYCIFTFPISLTYDTRMGRIEHYFDKFIFPMIEVRKKTGENHQAGISVIKEIIEKRADMNLFEAGALDFIIEKTGGSLRDVFFCIREAADIALYRAEKTGAETIVTGEDVKNALASLKSDITRRIVTGDYPALVKIHENKAEIEDQGKMLEFLRGHVVLEYNGERWHDCHPLIWDFVEENVNRRKKEETAIK